MSKALFTGRIIIPDFGVTIDRYTTGAYAFMAVRKHSFNRDSFSPENESGVDLSSPTAEVRIDDRCEYIAPAFSQVTNALIEDVKEFWIQRTAHPTLDEYLRTGSLKIAYSVM